MESAVQMMRFGKTSGRLTNYEKWRKSKPDACQAGTSHDFDQEPKAKDDWGSYAMLGCM
jgi:hypothetical protein